MIEQPPVDADGDPAVDRRAYGAVLCDDWVARLEVHAHPVDGSLVLSAPTPAGAADVAPIILLHGVGNDGRTFAPIVPTLAERRPVIAPRLHPDLLIATDDRAAAVAPMVEFLEALAPPPWQLVGHSMGGVLTGLLMRARPDLVDAAVFVNSPLPGVSRRFREGDTFDRTGRALLALKMLAQATSFGRPRLPGAFRGVEVALVRNALRGFVAEPRALADEVIIGAVIAARTRDADRFLRLARSLPEWELEPFTSAPVHIIAGADDPLLSADDLDAVATAYPDAWFQVLDGVSHFAHLERAHLTVSAIEAALPPLASARGSVLGRFRRH